jgi:acyl carrier protein
MPAGEMGHRQKESMEKITTLDETKQRLRKLLVETLVLEDMGAAAIRDDEPLFGGRLGLDSLDAMEIVVLLQRHFGLRITSPRQGKEILRTINTIAAWIHAQR